MIIQNRRNFIAGAGAALTVPAGGLPAFAGEARPEFIMRTTDAPPRCMKDDRGNWAGFEIDCLGLICEKAGVKLVPSDTYYVWGRALQLMKTGQIQFLTPVSYRADRAEYMDYLGVFDVEELVVVVRKEHAGESFETLDDFAKPDRIFERVDRRFHA